MIKRVFYSWWFLFAVAACFAVAGLLFSEQEEWLIGTAIMIVATNCVDLVFIGGGREARSDTTNQR